MWQQHYHCFKMHFRGWLDEMGIQWYLPQKLQNYLLRSISFTCLSQLLWRTGLPFKLIQASGWRGRGEGGNAQPKNWTFSPQLKKICISLKLINRLKQAGILEFGRTHILLYLFLEYGESQGTENVWKQEWRWWHENTIQLILYHCSI